MIWKNLGVALAIFAAGYAFGLAVAYYMLGVPGW